MNEKFVLAHELDVAWIIALWLAIHGGDPAPEVSQIDEQAERLATSLVEHLQKTLTPQRKEISVREIEAGLQALGIQVEERQVRAETRALPAAGTIICTEVPGPRHIYCFKMPAVKGPPSDGYPNP